MGYNDEGARRIVFDIETAPLPGAEAYLEPVEAPSNYKDPAKIADYIATKQAEHLDRCGLDVDLCRVVAIGWQVEGEAPQAHTAHTPDEERDLINTFWSRAGALHLVGFNCLAFDLPVLFRRGQYLNALVPDVQIDKYRHPRVTDLQMVLSFNGVIRFRGLGFYAKRFEIDVPDTLTGADMAQAVEDGRWEDVLRHVTADIERTALLAGRLGLFRVAEGGVA